MALYRRPAGLLAQAVPPRPVIEPGGALQFSAGADGLRFDGAAAGAGSQRVGVQLATLVTTTATVQLGDQTTQLELTPGAFWWWSAPQAGPISVTVRAVTPLLVRVAAVAAADYGAAPGLAPTAPQAVINPRLAVRGTTLVVDAAALTPERIQLSLDIWDRPSGRHWGWFGLEVPPAATPQQLHWEIELGADTTAATLNGAPLLVAHQAAGQADGEYTAALGVSIANRALLDPIKAFSFRASGGVAQAPVAWTRGLFSVPVWQPATALSVAVGDDTELLGYTLPATAPAGQPLGFALFWHARRAPGDERSVLVHLVDADGQVVAQGDGPPAGGARPVSGWRAGNYIRDDRTLDLAGVPPGTYTLQIGMYRFPSIERLPLRADGQPQPDDVLALPLTVTP